MRSHASRQLQRLQQSCSANDECYLQGVPNLQEEDVCALHAGVEYLGCAEVIALLAAHDLCALLYPVEVEAAGNVQHEGIILVRVAVDLLASIQEQHLQT